MKKLILTTMAVTALASGQAIADDHGSHGIMVHNVYAYPTKASMPAAAIFMEIVNNSTDNDRLIAVKVDDVERAEIHTMEMDGDIMRMRKVDGLDIPAGNSLNLSPGGHHVMVFGLEEDWNAGDDEDVTLVFEKAGEVEYDMQVIARDAEAKHDMDHGHHAH